jgi:hypothetical protein
MISRHRYINCFLLLSGIALCARLITGCAPTRFVKPLVPGTTAIGASFGGPAIKYSGAPIPVPLSSVMAGYGFREDITGFAGINTTSLAFGVLHTDVGMVKKVFMQDAWRPAIVVSPVVNMMFDRWDHKFSLFPQLDAHFYWHYLQKPNYFYLGISNWFDLNSKRSMGDVQKDHWVPIIDVGHRWIKPRWDYIVEVKYIAPNHSNKDIVVEYIAPGTQGALGVYFGVTWKHLKKVKPLELYDNGDDE